MTGHRQTGPAQVKALVVAVRGFLEGTRVRAAWMEPACYVLCGMAMMAMWTQAPFLWTVLPLGGIGVVCGIGRRLETLEWQKQVDGLEEQITVIALEEDGEYAAQMVNEVRR